MMVGGSGGRGGEMDGWKKVWMRGWMRDAGLGVDVDRVLMWAWTSLRVRVYNCGDGWRGFVRG